MVKKNICKVPSCIREVKSRGMCASHHTRMLKYFKEFNTDNEEEFVQYAYKRDTRSRVCNVVFCRRPVLGQGLCYNHYHLYYYHLKRQNITSIEDYLEMQKVDCYIEDCDGKVISKGFCRKHYNRYNQYQKDGIVKTKGDFAQLIQEDSEQVCRVMLCSNKSYHKSLCKNHFEKFKQCEVKSVREYLNIERSNIVKSIESK